MAEIMIPARGCVYMPRKSRSGSGFYYLTPALNGDADSPILIEGVDAGLSDIVYPVSTLDEKKYLFVMGEDFGNITISGVALLGKAEQNGKAFNRVMSYFQTYRSSAASGGTAPLSVSLPGNSGLKYHLTGLQVSKPDPQFHMQFFIFRGVIAEPKAP